MKIVLHYIGKARDAHANAMAAEYVKRSGRYAHCEMREIDPRRFDVWAKYPAGTKILLDPAGRTLNSAAFAGLVQKAEREARDLIFVTGGADGLPEGWRERADRLLSLTPLTLPHEMARVMLAEQIYRALATLRGHPYAR
ncbi:MAG: 23S rRNA (pseudouridine(1915)-N(3))-methyltransferase RlmH [Bryobacteraceae bacterium]